MKTSEKIEPLSEEERIRENLTPIQTKCKELKTKELKRTVQVKTSIKNLNLVDIDTGETFRGTTAITKEIKDCNFFKIWIFDFFSLTSCISSNKEYQVLRYLVTNMNAKNQSLGTQREISKKTLVSLKTVNTTIRKLCINGFMKKKTGYIIINPDIIFKGSQSKRNSILITYKKI